MANLDVVPVPSEHILMRRLGDETVFLSEDGRAIHTLNGVATFIWDRIDGRASLRAILADLLAHYEVDEEAARRDLVALVDDLAAVDLVTIGG